MTALRTPPTPGAHANVLMHILGFLQARIDPGDKAELLALIDEYRRGGISLSVPVAAIRRRFERYPNDYIACQYYLYPDPRELLLRGMT
jgi:uncharacterized protein YbgA (DUF1722 family)